uniref:Centrosomal protein POC5 n=1 Tax=Leptobrachium leishanense TaxID=445787 RepID=A0A8C5Q978_9ANUR
MSSDDESSRSVLVPKDSDHGSSVSSDLQDEYDELLQYAVVTPKLESFFPRDHQQQAEQTKNGRYSRQRETVQEQISVKNSCVSSLDHIRESSGRASKTAVTEGAALHMSPLTVCNPEEHITQRALVTGMEPFSDVHSEDLSIPSSSNFQTGRIRVTELPVCPENMKDVENLLDLWSANLKTNVMVELSKWKLTIIEQHELEMKKHREQYNEDISRLSNHIDSLQDILQTNEASMQRKDETLLLALRVCVISKLAHALEKQRQKVRLMRAFTHWKIQYSNARQENYVCNLADRHHTNTLLKNTWRAWRSIIEANWKDKVEKACRARAEDVCVELSNEYESRLTQLNGALEDAKGEVQRLQAERGHYEGSMKKAFMRGVCALNLEAMSMFQGKESRMEHADFVPRREEFGSSPSVVFQHPLVTASCQQDQPSPLHPSTSEQTFRPHFGPSSASLSKEDDSIPVVMSATASGSSLLSTQKQPLTRVVTSGQQKAGRTITARITARSDLTQKIGKAGVNVMSMGVSPPMASVVVEKHHPVTQISDY